MTDQSSTLVGNCRKSVGEKWAAFLFYDEDKYFIDFPVNTKFPIALLVVLAWRHL